MRIPVDRLIDGGGAPAPKPAPKATPKPAATPVANFTPQVKMPTPAKVPGQKGFVGPVATALQTGQAQTPAAQSNMGPQGGLPAGVIAGVTGAGTSTTTSTTTKTNTTWTKAGTVQTAAGPVDVDANGLAQDGSTPIAVGQDKDEITIELVDTQLDDYGNTVGIYSDGSTKVLIKSGNRYRSTVDEDAYSIIKKTLEDYDLGALVPIVQGYMDRGLGSNQASLEIRKEPAYQKRFKGNENRIKAGLNAISEAAYLELENSYSETLKAYGLSSQFGTDREARQAAMSEIIGGNVSADEFQDRIKTVVTRVKNADPAIKSTMASFFNIKDEDLVSYFINPKENLPKLQEKVTAAEIGAAAKGQNLATSAEAATALAQFGVDRQAALEGYQAIGEVLPTATKLGQIYGDTYTQTTAEQEVFQGLASAKRKRQQLAEREVASFSGSSGRLRTGRPTGNTGQF
jgi:hypothetical protein